MLEHIYAKGTSAYFGDDDGIHVDMSVFLRLSYKHKLGFLISYSISRGIAFVTFNLCKLLSNQAIWRFNTKG
jgi:hypothetical protein